MVIGVVLVVIISMALQVPELAVTAYMVFFLSKESKPSRSPPESADSSA